MTDEHSSAVEHVNLDEGWTLSIFEHSDNVGGFTYIISGAYSPEYQQAHNFKGGRTWSQGEVTRYESQQETREASLHHYDQLKTNPGFPFPDKM